MNNMSHDEHEAEFPILIIESFGTMSKTNNSILSKYRFLPLLC